MSSTTLNQLIEDFSHLKLDDKEYAVDVIKKQLIEAKREAIAKRAEEAMANLKKGMIKKGTVKELYKDLEGD
jgi:ribosomal protein S1